jgi:hypothetical protein
VSLGGAGHESTITHFVTLTMSQKKMFGRFVIGMIRSPALVTVASIILGLAEVSFALTMSVRDKAIYRFTCARPNADADPLAAIKAKKLMRARNAHMETQLEVRSSIHLPPLPAIHHAYSSTTLNHPLVMNCTSLSACSTPAECSHTPHVQMAFTILMSFVVPLSYNLSIDGKHPDAGELLGSVAVQVYELDTTASPLRRGSLSSTYSTAQPPHPSTHYPPMPTLPDADPYRARRRPGHRRLADIQM